MFNHFSKILLLIMLTTPLSAEERMAFPENRGHSPGYESKTVTAIRKSADEYSSKIIGSPISMPAGTTVHSVWFVMEYVFLVPDPDIEHTLRTGIFRGGITTFDHFSTNPLESPLDENPDHLPGNFAFNSGTGLDESAFTALQRQRISVLPIESLPGLYLVGIGFEKPWTAESDTTVWAWVNVEYPTGDQLVRVYTFQDLPGEDVQVNQQEELTPLGYTSMIWVEQGHPFDNQTTFQIEFAGSKRKRPVQTNHFKSAKIYKNRPFTVTLSVDGDIPQANTLDLYMRIRGKQCATPIVTLSLSEVDSVTLEGKKLKAPRKRIPVEFLLFDSETVIASTRGKLLNRKYRGSKRGKLNKRQIQKACAAVSLQQ
jgi:hypothetical protein